MKRLVPKVLENTYHVYSYKVQLVYNYTTDRNRMPGLSEKVLITMDLYLLWFGEGNYLCYGDRISCHPRRVSYVSPFCFVLACVYFLTLTFEIRSRIIDR